MITIVLATMSFYSCTNHNQQTEIHHFYGGTLNVILSSSAENLDPQKLLFKADWQVASLVYEGLFANGEDIRTVEPLLVESWEKLDAGKRIVLTLRDNIYFHDDPCFENGVGRKLTTDDVIYTFERIAAPEINSSNWYLFEGKIEGVNEFFQGIKETISGIKKLDERRIEFQLTKPYVSFIKLLASPTAYIVPREAVEYYGENFKQHPVGTGPFRLVRWKQWQEMLFVKNEKYWRSNKSHFALPFVDTIRFRILSNSSMKVSEFLKGEFDFLAVNHNEYQQLKLDGNFQNNFKIAFVEQGLESRFLGFSLDTNSDLARHVPLRQALAMGFNVKSTCKQLTPDLAKPATSLVPPEFFSQKEMTSIQWYDYRPDQSSKLVESICNQLQGNQVTIGTNILTPALEIFKLNACQIGFSAKINLHSVRYYPFIVEDRPDLFRVSFHPSYPDPEEFYTLFYSKSDPTVNLTGYKNAEYDAILEQSMVEHGEAKRQKLFLELEKILKRDVPAIYLLQAIPQYYLSPKNLNGLKIRFGIQDFSEVWIDRPDENN